VGAFRDLLARLAQPPLPAALYVLGDLFDVWMGPASLAETWHEPILEALRMLSDRGVAVTVFQGNRDFLLDGLFAARTGARVVAEGLSVRLGPYTAFLSHGDRLVVGDRGHQRLRWILRSAWGREVAAGLPRRAVAWTAAWLRRRSERAGARRRPGKTEVPAQVAARIFRAGHEVIIAGHLHHECCRRIEIDGQGRQLFILGAWEDGASALVFDGTGFSFQRLPLASGGHLATAPSTAAGERKAPGGEPASLKA
jgi:UDP-2,3-diacylglucosamine hydrolase